jgi:hypothetical protein
MNYGALTFSPHELPTMTLDPIKLPFYDTSPPFVSQMDSQQREKFFVFHFCPYFKSLK